MSDDTTTFESIVPAPGSIVPGSIAAMAQANGGRIAPPEVIIIFDHSGSTEIIDANLLDGRRVSRYQAACEQLAIIQARLPGKIAVLAFADEVTPCPGGVPPEPTGFTNLTGALRFAREADTGAVRFIVISDGAPNNKGTALAVAGEYAGQIDTVLVGELDEWERKDCTAFMEELARIGRGTFTRDASGMRFLGETVIKMLGNGDLAGGRGGRGPIVTS